MTIASLRTDDELRAACERVSRTEEWGAARQQWLSRLSDTLAWVWKAGEAERATAQFQQKLWEENHVAATGQ